MEQSTCPCSVHGSQRLGAKSQEGFSQSKQKGDSLSEAGMEIVSPHHAVSLVALPSWEEAMLIHDSSLGPPLARCFRGEGQRWLSYLSGQGRSPFPHLWSVQPRSQLSLMARLSWQLREDQSGKQERLGLICPGRKPN